MLLPSLFFIVGAIVNVYVNIPINANGFNISIFKPVVQKLVGAMVIDRVKKGIIFKTTNFMKG